MSVMESALEERTSFSYRRIFLQRDYSRRREYQCLNEICIDSNMNANYVVTRAHFYPDVTFSQTTRTRVLVFFIFIIVIF